MSINGVVAQCGGAVLIHGSTNMIELFNVVTIVKQFHGWKDVTFKWFRNDPEKGRPYHELIKDYHPGEYYSESCIDEMFSRDEANALKEYLDRDYGNVGITTLERVDLPIPNNLMGVGAIAVDGGDDFYMLDKAEGYPLSFSVWGYFNLVGCQLVGGSDVYHHRLMLLFPDGTFRQQTNEEAARDARK
jgi:hypothetical protein